MWIGDFVRCHTVVRVLKARFPQRPIDVLATPLTALLVAFMPGVRRAIVGDLPRGQLALSRQWDLAKRLRDEAYGTVLVMPATWKSALAPFLARIPERVGFFGEGRLLLLNDVRWGSGKLRRMVDRCATLALPDGTPMPPAWPLPQMKTDPAAVAAWRSQHVGADDRPAVALCPGAIGPGKQWPVAHYGELARRLAANGIATWVTGSLAERPLATEIAAAGGPLVRDFTGPLRDAVLMLAAARAVVANDSGLLHIAAALGTPSVGIFGPTDPRLWGPLNPVAYVESPYAAGGDDARRRVDDVTVDQVYETVRRVMADNGPAARE
jgi:heptosyltransferase-2